MDESGTDSSGPLKCSAGYLFEPANAETFRETWAPFLKDHGLTDGFHANKVFHERSDWEHLFGQLAALIKNTAHRGFLRFMQRELAIDPRMRKATGSDYSMCTLSCMERMADFAKQHGRQIVYFIEGGNEYEGELRHFIDLVKLDAELTEHFAMIGADTYKKKDVIQLQAADLFAWEFRRSAWLNRPTPNIRFLVNGKSEPGNPGHYASGFSEVSLFIHALVNASRGMYSNQRKFLNHGTFLKP